MKMTLTVMMITYRTFRDFLTKHSDVFVVKEENVALHSVLRNATQGVIKCNDASLELPVDSREASANGKSTACLAPTENGMAADANLDETLNEEAIEMPWTQCNDASLELLVDSREASANGKSTACLAPTENDMAADANLDETLNEEAIEMPWTKVNTAHVVVVLLYNGRPRYVLVDFLFFGPSPALSKRLLADMIRSKCDGLIVYPFN
ncbi:hypothetical protein HPB52_004733 [Rhipicephalus sanguineus]|uniref:Uncharacterized protein n=1 Tax=Rhipicephalus sanguineus TaxID=34632 RepID=A0A9D4PQF7_RHISA|nr:hypothetical protein HPB52_004733 [Rhipicephalus sanguineus]